MFAVSISVKGAVVRDVIAARTRSEAVDKVIAMLDERAPGVRWNLIELTRI